MIRINENYLKLKASYLFSDIAKRVAAYQQRRPEPAVIRLGIGDVTRALPETCIAAFHEAVDEMAADATFRGYGPEQGYDFLREAIAENDFKARGADIDADEIFVSDGAKCDTGNIQEIFAADVRIAIPDPVYPVYLDTNVMAGRSGTFRDGRYEGIVYLDGTADNGFIPDLPAEPVDLIYLCFPNNPTGATISREQLKTWVDFAAANRAIILYDAAYEAFIRDDTLPHSIYEIDGARNVAIEFRSFSKTAGFTGTRCAYTVVPKSLMAYTVGGEPHSVHQLWNRRHSTKFNGVSYPVQQAAAAVYTDAGRREVAKLIRGIHGQCRHHPQRDAGPGVCLHRRGKRPVHLGSDKGRLLGVLRHAPGKGRCGLHAGRRLRHLRRGLYSHQRIQQPRKCDRRHGPHSPGPEIMTLIRK